MASTCLQYLSFDAFEAGPCLSFDELRRRRKTHVLFDYAAKDLGKHMLGTLFVGERGVGVHDFPGDFLGIHYASYLGLADVVCRLLDQKREDLDVADSYRRTPLTWAAEDGHETVVKVLLDRMSAVYLEGEADWTLFSNSDARDIHESELDTYIFCMTGFSPNATNMLSRTPSSWAAEEGL
ncbi:hypothetical protein ASPACDRAFT_1855295 [Aspergillus aculeatus ATCC 16872]|uniref:Uncharacterized protein n=1 Tax=Aspergillus aculeatus (strain ATCC 16872 / CBS 172.66 / WB 5094) TaxID=690307 RepID=A0A1L9WWX3_ASPA1|nr:uncharacterized protein ASPACDRAFT_1855295 [Aspergillus aculeatus ATCC 16872]OJK00745.1 hypothetical protein ASPACDRAFT_1855295 [Aspergillus aculeatus ATCC 16872]